jgi:hypothetical protein
VEIDRFRHVPAPSRAVGRKLSALHPHARRESGLRNCRVITGFTATYYEDYKDIEEMHRSVVEITSSVTQHN